VLLLALDMSELERALAGGPTLLLLCAVVVLGGGVVPFLTLMWIKALSNGKREVRELLQGQITSATVLTEQLITSRDALKSCRAALDANTRVMRSILGSADGHNEGGAS
jgi:hypothetical protein